MRIRLSLTLDIERRSPASEVIEHEHRDNDTLVESSSIQPIGFVPVHPMPDEP